MRKRTILTPVALLLSLLAWEGALRLFVLRPINYRHDAALGWMPEPRTAGLHTGEGRGLCAYNERGFRGPPIAPRAAGELRVACLGDSFTEGQQMDYAETFPARLEAGLARRLPRVDRDAGPRATGVRVFNGGRGATSPAYLVGFSDAYRSAFDPDWVVALVRDASWDATTAQGAESEARYRVEGDRVEVVTSFRWERLSRWERALVLSPLRHLAIAKQAAARMSELGKHPANLAATTDRAGLSERGALTPVREAAMGFTVRELRRRYARLVIAHMPDASPTRQGLAPPSELEARLAERCAEEGVPFVPVRPYLEADSARTGRVPYGFANTLPWTGHPNADGHRLIAAALLDFFDPAPELASTEKAFSPL